jgi:transposase-like protein
MAPDFPKNLMEFETQFATEDACLAYVRRKKWPAGFRCARCGGIESWTLTRRRLEECRQCHYQESVTAGTVFHQTKKPLRLWFRAITLWVVSKRALSAKELARQLGLHYETAWYWCHRLRACVGARFGTEALSGKVEVDERPIGGSDDRAPQAHSISGRKALVAGAVEVREASMGRVRLGHLTGKPTPALELFAARVVERNALARVAGRQRSYKGHCATDKATPHIQRVFSLFRRLMLGTFHGSVSHKHLTAYLHEFQFRFNRRNSKSRWLLFERVISGGGHFRPPTLAHLTARASDTLT